MRHLFLAVLFTIAGTVHAQFSVPGYELVQSAPLETTLHSADLRGPAAVWSELFDHARSDIAIAQFYAVGKAGTPFDTVFERLAAAGRRGVKIRFLLEQKGIGLSDPATLQRLRAIPNLELRMLDYSRVGGGIIHAKYLVVDGKLAYVGSQNFDWRSFSHIHETGLRISDPAVVAQIHAIFEQDWQAQAALAAGQALQAPPPAPPAAPAATLPDHGAFLLASPAAFNPPGVLDSQAALPALLAEAKHEVRVQLLDYAPLSYGPGQSRPYYAVIDNALRAAAARGVRIKLMVSNWNTEKPAIDYLKSLAMLPNIEIRIVTLPRWSGGFIPFARVIHSKTMSIDGRLAWIGTSNWSGGYLDTSRNLEIVLRNETMAQRVAQLHEQTWSSPYAAPLDVEKTYPAPEKGMPAPTNELPSERTGK